jgi:hypothetical protein
MFLAGLPESFQEFIGLLFPVGVGDPGCISCAPLQVCAEPTHGAALSRTFYKVIVGKRAWAGLQDFGR